MPICVERRFVYVHIPKCAGKSITDALRRSGARLSYLGKSTPQERQRFGPKSLWLHHLKASQLHDHLGAERWADSFKFAFVRNPWDLMVSYYHYQRLEAITSEEFRRSWPNIAGRFDASNDFGSWLRSGIYVEPQVAFITGQDGRLLVDFVGRFESLESDFANVARQIGLSIELRHLNATDHAAYQRYYDDETEDIVARHFASDINLFGYRFE